MLSNTVFPSISIKITFTEEEDIFDTLIFTTSLAGLGKTLIEAFEMASATEVFEAVKENGADHEEVSFECMALTLQK